jgi:hypothetical protein
LTQARSLAIYLRNRKTVLKADCLVLSEHRHCFEGGHLLKVDAPEKATILAALRHYQTDGYGEPDNRPDDIHEIACDGNEVISLDAEGIGKLFNRIKMT